MKDLNKKYCTGCGIYFDSLNKLRAHQLWKCVARDNKVTLASQLPPPGDRIRKEDYVEKEIGIRRKARHNAGAPVSFLKKRKRSDWESDILSKPVTAEQISKLLDEESSSSSSSDEKDPYKDVDDPNLKAVYQYFDSYADSRGYSDIDLSDENDEQDRKTTLQHVDPQIAPEQQSNQPYTDEFGIAGSDRFQIDLAHMLKKYRCPLALHDDIINLVKNNANGDNLMFNSDNLKKREEFIKSMEKRMKCESMRPRDVDVRMSNGEEATMSVFNMEAMILSLLQDPELMKEENLVSNYDLYTGKPTSPVTHYGEIHTGEAWEPARQHFCGDVEKNMPLGLVIFADKSHFDKHGALATTPFIFTLSIFNEHARNRPEFWRPMAYMPNLKYGKVASDSKDNVQDEHNCIAEAMRSLVNIAENGGISTTVKGKEVVVKVWIHYVIGDTQGNNEFVGQYNSSAKFQMQYRDCKCPWRLMNLSNPDCCYIKPEDIEVVRKRAESARSDTAKQAEWKKISKHDIVNAWMQNGVPLSDIVYGIYRMLPPELLHTTSEGITEYMLSSFKKTVNDMEKGGGKDVVEEIEKLHQQMHNSKRRNSERDIPLSASRCGLLKDTLVNAMERRGNVFLLLCMSYTDHMQNVLKPILEAYGTNLTEMQECLKLYLSMEEWFHGHNPKNEVKSSRELIAKVIELIKKIFPREDGHGWNVSKVHGLTKMQFYITLFGSGINFFGGPGECNHKRFVKDTGKNTQGRVDSFNSQVATRYYESTVLTVVKKISDKKIKEQYELVEKVSNDNDAHDAVPTGVFTLSVEQSFEPGFFDKYTCSWKKKDKYRAKCDVPHHFVSKVSEFMCSEGLSAGYKIDCYNSCVLTLHGREETFRSSSCYMGEPWYDWCLFKATVNGKRRTRPGRIMGFFLWRKKFHAVVHKSVTALNMSRLEDEFIAKFELSGDPEKDYLIISVKQITHPLFVFQNYGGSINEYFCSLPRRKWGRYFGDQINRKSPK